jgi:DNA-binding transcriptional MerR regulator
MADKAASAYRTISEAGEETGLPAHVLRFWESKFSQLRPVKRAGGRRLYRPQDISLILGLKHLLYEEGFTIKGAQKYIKDHGVAELVAMMEQGSGASIGPATVASPSDAAPTAEPARGPSSDLSAATLFDAPTSGAAQPARGDETDQMGEVLAQLRAAKSARDSVRPPARG